MDNLQSTVGEINKTISVLNESNEAFKNLTTEQKFKIAVGVHRNIILSNGLCVGNAVNIHNKPLPLEMIAIILKEIHESIVIRRRTDD